LIELPLDVIGVAVPQIRRLAGRIIGVAGDFEVGVGFGQQSAGGIPAVERDFVVAIGEGDQTCVRVAVALANATLPGLI
jgi:hypothetical protein